MGERRKAQVNGPYSAVHVPEAAGPSEDSDRGQVLQKSTEVSEKGMFMGHDVDREADSENFSNSYENTTPAALEVRAAIDAALAVIEAERASKPSYQQCREVPEVELQIAVSSILRCRRSVDLDSRVVAFEDFRRAV